MYAHAIVAQEIIHYFFLIISLAFTNTQSYGSHFRFGSCFRNKIISCVPCSKSSGNHFLVKIQWFVFPNTPHQMWKKNMCQMHLASQMCSSSSDPNCSVPIMRLNVNTSGLLQGYNVYQEHSFMQSLVGRDWS